MSHVGRKHGPTAESVIEEARAVLGDLSVMREQEIAALPRVQWKGRELYTVRCQGTSGKGSHDVNVPLAMVWHLIDLRQFYCVYHAGDAMASSSVLAMKEERVMEDSIIEIDERGEVHGNDLEHALSSALNRFSAENASNTPDWILAQYLLGCLAAWDTAVQQRETWHGRDGRPSSEIATTG